jgi:HlyD family secretion protein
LELESDGKGARRWRWWAGGAALLCVVGLVALPKLRTKPGPRYELATVERGSVVAKVTATGVLSALVTVQVGTQVSGRIATLLVDFNSAVKKDDVIARIDPALFTANVQQSKANWMAALAAVKQAKVKAVDANRVRGRDRELRKQNLIAQADLDTAETNAEAAEAAVEAAAAAVDQSKAQLDQAQVNLNYCTVRSPINGVVISRSVDVGQTVAASLAAPTLFTIAEDLSRMQVDTSVAEADVGRLKPGMEATFTVDAYPNERFKGTIRQIRNAAQTVQNVVTYDAVIDVQNPELKLKPGMTANCTVIYAEEHDVLRVPNAALRYHPMPEPGAKGEWKRSQRGASGKSPNGGSPPGQPGVRMLWVLRDGKPTGVKVKLGLTDGTFTQVEGELQEGDQAVTGLLDSSNPQGPGPGGPPGAPGFRFRM